MDVFMDILKAIFLGLVQGLTEFIPVSSSGHLVLFQKMLGIEEASMNFDIILHIGTLVPVFIVFWKDIAALLKKPLQKLTFLLIVGTLPTVIVALVFKDVIDNIFETGNIIGINFIITGLLFLLTDRVKPGTKRLSKVTYTDAFIVGIFQAIAVFPAISRSGMTITGSLLRGLDKETAPRFSFLLSIPAIMGALVLTIVDMLKADEAAAEASLGVIPTIFGFVVAAVSGYFAIRFMLHIIKNKKLSVFSYYLFGLGALILLDQFVFHLFF